MLPLFPCTSPLHPSMSRRPLPMLCDCTRLEGCMEHRDTDSTYVLWVLHNQERSHVVFLHKQWLNALEYTDGQTFLQLLSYRSPEECCKMISRTLLGALRYRPDYIVIVSDEDRIGAPLASGMSMETALSLAPPDLAGIRSLAEGKCLSVGGEEVSHCNFLGVRLSSLCRVLADRDFFHDPKTVRYRQCGHQSLNIDTAPATNAAVIQVSW